MAEIPSTEKYVAAFRATGSLTSSYLKMLQFQYNQPGRAATARQLANAVGYRSYNAGNLHYGTLGRIVGEHLESNSQTKSAVLATGRRPEGEEYNFIMRPQVAEALEELGWVGSEEAVIVANSIESAFRKFRVNNELHFVAKLRMLRAQQIRHQMSNPDEIELDTFNREVWQHDTGRYLVSRSGERINLYDAEFEERELALREGRIELHGNQIWGNADGIRFDAEDQQRRKDRPRSFYAAYS